MLIMERFDSLKFRGRNVIVGRNVTFGKNVRIGDNTVIYDNVHIGDNTVVCNDCVLGEPLNDYYHNTCYENPALFIGADSLIRSHSIFYAGSSFGDKLQTGHRVTVRENAIVGNNCQFGSYNDIQGECVLGDYVRCQSYVNIGQYSKIGNFVFIFPYVVLTNDPTPPSMVQRGVTIGDFSVITSATVMLPGVTLGRHCLTAANSTVGGHFDDYSFIAGTPAKKFVMLGKLHYSTKSLINGIILGRIIFPEICHGRLLDMKNGLKQI